MIKALLLIFEPASTWDSIVQNRRSIAFLFFVYLLPLLIIPSLIEGYGLVHLGEYQDNVQSKRFFSVREAGIFEAVQVILMIIICFIGAHTIKSMGDTFHGRHNYAQAFTLVVYGLGPMLLLRVFDALPISPWIAWAAGMLLTMTILYHGVPRVMEPDPSHAFGLYLTSWLLLVLITGLLRFTTAAYLSGKMPHIQKLLAVV